MKPRESADAAPLWFPDPETAVAAGSRAGLVAVGGDLSWKRLLLAYQNGLYPWTDDPVTWWSPDPRSIFELAPAGLHLPRSLARTLRAGGFEVTVNRAFPAVIRACAASRRGGTWISPAFIAAYTELHERGHVHSVECWQDGRLAGGIYGVAVGGLFAGESMFHRANDASKVALFHLHHRLRERGFRLFDIQMTTPVTEALGAVEIPRREYLRRLREAVAVPCVFP